MTDDTKKAFEKGERFTREALDKGTATAEQAARQAEQSYSNAAGGIADLNTKNDGNGAGQYDGGFGAYSRLVGRERTDRSV